MAGRRKQEGGTKKNVAFERRSRFEHRLAQASDARQQVRAMADWLCAEIAKRPDDPFVQRTASKLVDRLHREAVELNDKAERRQKK